jgi:hypothetical protein
VDSEGLDLLHIVLIATGGVLLFFLIICVFVYTRKDKREIPSTPRRSPEKRERDAEN